MVCLGASSPVCCPRCVAKHREHARSWWTSYPAFARRNDIGCEDDMALRIVGIGTAVPKYSISQADAAEASKSFCYAADEQLRLIPALYRRSGVSRRHSVLLEAPAGDPFERQSFYSKVTGENDGGPTTLDRMNIYEREAPPLALHAAREAVADAGVDPTSITHTIHTIHTKYTIHIVHTIHTIHFILHTARYIFFTVGNLKKSLPIHCLPMELPQWLVLEAYRQAGPLIGLRLGTGHS